MVKAIFNRRRDARLSSQQVGIQDVSIKNGEAKGNLVQFEEDGQIEFFLKRYLGNSSLVVRLVLEIEFSDSEITPKVYLDYGQGYSEDLTVPLFETHNDNGFWVAYIIAPHLLRSARLDIAETRLQVKIGSIVAEQAAIKPFLEHIMRFGHKAAASFASYKAAAAIGYIEGFRDQLSSYDEAKCQALMIGAVTRGLHTSGSGTAAADEKYLSWIARTENITTADADWMRSQVRSWDSPPLLSIVMPVFDPPIKLLQEAIASIQNQTYSNWELCIADDASRDPNVRLLLSELERQDSRIKVAYRETNGHISEASNSAASKASGDFIVLMDNDDLLPIHALWTVAYYINRNKDCDLFYSDEDKISIDGFRCEPYNKGSFDRFLMYGHNMFSHLGIYRRSIFNKVGGFRKGYEGSQDYDLTLRCMEVCGEERIGHIPHVLYHWRQIAGSTSMGAGEKSYAFEAAKRALNDHYTRCNYPLEAIDSRVPGISSVRTLAVNEPCKISIIIPTRDGLEVLKPCVDSLLNYSDPLMEIIIVDNGSELKETEEYFLKLSRDSFRIKVVRCDEPFNFSRLCNIGVSSASGDIVCLLNNDTEIISAGIFDRVRAWLSIDDVGVIGARLLYPDGTLQHFGVYTGVGEHKVAEHCYLGLQDSHHVNFSKSQLLQQFSAVTGACMFMRKADYIEVGGCDESLPVAYNDIDLCIRIRQHGRKIICDPYIRLIHKESKSRGRDITEERKARLQRDAKKIVEKLGERSFQDGFYSPNFARNHADFSIESFPRSLPPWKSPQ